MILILFLLNTRQFFIPLAAFSLLLLLLLLLHVPIGESAFPEELASAG